MVSATAEPRPATVPSTPMEAALDALRSRFPNQVVIGFEELWDVRPVREPQIDLGPANSTLEQVLAGIRRQNPKYKSTDWRGVLAAASARSTVDTALRILRYLQGALGS